jgi:hypothetical protein
MPSKKAAERPILFLVDFDTLEAILGHIALDHRQAGRVRDPSTDKTDHLIGIAPDDVPHDLVAGRLGPAKEDLEADSRTLSGVEHPLPRLKTAVVRMKGTGRVYVNVNNQL